MNTHQGWKRFALAVAAASVLAVPTVASGAIDMFLKVGDMKGESLGEIDVLAWSWGLQRGGQAAVGPSRAARGACVSALSVTNYIDLATPDLLQSVATGRTFPQATLTVRKAGARPLEFLVLTFTNVTVSSESTDGSGGEDRLTENISLEFQSVQGHYVQQAPDGSQGGQPKCGFSAAACPNK